jgi:hypothetical protein
MKKFLTSVANIYGYDDSTGAILFVGKTLLDSSIETTLASSDVRAGRGNQLQYVYYHTAEMGITISDSQWNLDFLSKAVGSGITTGINIFTEETITLGAAGTGTVLLGTPIAVTGTTIYGWVTQHDGSVEKVTFSSKTFATSTGTSGDEVCVRYYAVDSAARSITISANMIPSIVHLVLEAQLNSSDSTTNQIGTVQIDIPKATLTGAFSIKMTPDGVASTPLTARALASEDTSSTACDHSPYYATIKEIISAAKWYDNVIALGIEGGDFSQAQAVSGTTLKVWAIPAVGLPFRPPVADLIFTSGTVGTATIGEHTGIITNVGTGTTLLTATIELKNTIDASVTMTGTA